jgi:hypothetical protein
MAEQGEKHELYGFTRVLSVAISEICGKQTTKKAFTNF